MPSNSAGGQGADSHPTCPSCHRGRANSKLRIVGCPRSVVKRRGVAVGNPGYLVTWPCRRQRCPVCGPAMAKAWAEKVRSVGVGKNERLLYVTWTLRSGEKGMTIADTFRLITAASSFSILALRRPVAGARAQKAWSGLTCEYALALDVHESGAAHRQGMLRVSALPGSKMPDDNAIGAYLSLHFNNSLGKAMKQPDGLQLGGVYLDHVRSADGTAIYCALAEERHWEVGKVWPFAPRTRRLLTSRGFFK